MKVLKEIGEFDFVTVRIEETVLGQKVYEWIILFCL